MKIKLELKKHCIETAARKAHERRIRQLMKRNCAEQMLIEAQFEALQYFLENADFGYLRSEYRELSGNQPIEVSLEVGDDPGDLVILAGNRRIMPRWLGSSQ